MNVLKYKICYFNSLKIKLCVGRFLLHCIVMFVCVSFITTKTFIFIIISVISLDTGLIKYFVY